MLKEKDQVYYYEFFTGLHLPPEQLDIAKEEGWEIGSTNQRPPIPTKGVPVYTHHSDRWYVRPPADNNVQTFEAQWEINPLATPVVVDKNKRFFVLDDIFMDINNVIRDSEKLRYALRVWNFYGQSSDIVHCSALLHAIGSIIGRPVTYLDKSLQAGFKYHDETDKDKHNRVHVDKRADWAVIIFMNETQSPLRSGTVLYRHKDFQTLVDRDSWSMETAKRMYIEGYDSNNFQKLYDCPNVQNRILIYRANIFHSVGDFFNGRLVYRMFLKEREPIF